MRTITLLCLMLLGITAVRATHLLGGYVQATPISGPSLTYRVSAVLYMDEIRGKQAADQANAIQLCLGDGTTATAYRANRLITNDNTTSINSYTLIHTYSAPSTYTVSFVLSSRTGVQNITNADTQLFSLNTTFLINSSNSNQTPTAGFPQLRIGTARKATLLLKATDADGDSLVYELAKPLAGIEPCGWKAVPSYRFPNDITQQGTFKLNSQTGDLVWDAPVALGYYSISLLISEYRKGVQISQTTQEITVIVEDQPGSTTPIPPYEPATAGTGSIVTETVLYSDPDIMFVTFPNPVESRLQVVLQTSNPTTATLQLSDVNGKKLQELIFNQAARQHEQIMGMDGLKPGIYLLRADVNGRSFLRKLIKK
ncbi:T9SS type A sorting domain-containing protein [Spirosoma gilvum]